MSSGVRNAKAMSPYGTFETCRRNLGISWNTGSKQPTVKMTRLTLADILVGKRCSDPTFS
jgi:hypothetical protein